MRLFAWLVGFQWHEVHKGHIAPYKFNEKAKEEKKKKQLDLDGIFHTVLGKVNKKEILKH